MSSSAKTAAHGAKNSRAVHVLARAGFAASGVVHIIVGLIAVSLALGLSGGGQADQSGALAQLAAAPGGVFLLWAATIGLAALGLWHLLSAFLDRSASDGKERAVHIVKNASKGVVYLVIAFSAGTFAAGGSTSSAGSTRSLTADLLSTPGGVFLVVAIGLVVIGIAGYLVFKGATRRFERDLSLPSGTAGRGVRILGTVGYIARGVAFAGVGVLFLVGAATNDPEKSTGLDGALRSFAELPAGKILLVLIGAGWIAYGVYAFFRARYTRL
ncbi:DUF1206 domain-containing protein [Microbacterium sp. LMI1x-1-1.1]|uniref:DUF1206 domain-containing protein n=1 Tax=Microbacterium sp. LMI1x-1-1.1 TaxID=3135246 RepID=UPI00342BA44D